MSRSRELADLFHAASTHHADTTTHRELPGWSSMTIYPLSGALNWSTSSSTGERTFDNHYFAEVFYSIGGADGVFEVDLTVTPAAAQYSRDLAIGTMVAYDSSTDTHYPVIPFYDHSLGKIKFLDAATSQWCGVGVPFAWSSGDKLFGTYSYRVNV